MKKIISLLLVVVMMCTFVLSANAATLTSKVATKGINVNLVEDENGIVTATVSAVGVTLTGISLQMTYVGADVALLGKDGNPMSLTGSNAAVSSYVDQGAITTANWKETTKASTSKMTVEYSRLDSSYAGIDATAGSVDLFSFKFKKVGTLSASSVALVTAAFGYAYYNDAGAKVQANNSGDNFGLTIVSYEASTPDPEPEEPETPSYEATEEEVNAKQDWTSGEFKYPTDKVGGTDNAAVGKKVAAFGKAGTALTDGNYGIKIGNRFYPGRIDVPQGSYFAIIVVNTNGDEAIEGSYTYDIYTGKDSDPTWVATGLNAVVE